MDEPLRPGEGILHHPEGVDLMPADIQLSGMEVSLVNAMSRETILRQYLDTLKGQYSHILIDCQPSLGMLTVNALAAANRIIIPVPVSYTHLDVYKRQIPAGVRAAASNNAHTCLLSFFINLPSLFYLHCIKAIQLMLFLISL